jgi:lipopolysaccharide export system permease protein
VRIIDRYIIREISVPFALGLAIFTLILLVARILRLVELVVNRGVPFLQVLELFSFILPSFLEVTVPMAMLLGVMVALGRLSADNEIVALRSGGVSLLQIARPVAAVAVGTLLVALALSLYARPWGNRLLRDGLYEVAKVRASAGIRPKIFNDDFAGLVLYVDEVVPPGNVLQGILISGDFDPAREIAPASSNESGRTTTVVAKAGVLVSDEASHVLTLRLYEGSLHSVERNGSAYHRTDFGTYDVTLDLNVAFADLKSHTREPKELTTRELLAHRRAGSGSDGDTQRLNEVELARRFSLPFACLGFAAVAIPLGIRPSSAARARSFAVSLGLIFAYYLLLTMGESLAERRVLPSLVALWIPNVVLYGLAVALYRQSSGEVPRVIRGGGLVRRAGARITSTIAALRSRPRR